MTTSTRASAAFYDATDAASSDFAALLEAIPKGANALVLGLEHPGYAHRLASGGVTTTAIDPRPESVDAAREGAAGETGASATFGVADLEELRFDDHSFDAVVAANTLHRTDLARVYAETARVLTPEGRAYLLEPLGHNPLINAYRRRTAHERGRFEHPVRREDLLMATRWFHHVDVRTHHLASLAGSALGLPKAQRILGGVDRVLLSDRSPLRWQGWLAVVELRWPR